MAVPTTSQALEITFNAVLEGGDEPSAWTVVNVPNSGTILGTRKPVKVEGTIDGRPFAATLLPNGDGTHMLPLKAAVRKAIGKGVGDEVSVRIERRRS